jgi:hypothetical protein
MNNQMIFVRIATINDIRYVDEIIKETAASAIARGTGIAKRTPESVAQKMRDGKAVIALTSNGKWVGFSYFEAWEGCKSCPNYDILERKHKCNCLCTAMLFDPLVSASHSILPGHDLSQRYVHENAVVNH